MGKVIGIDLGTTFSAVAHVSPEGKPEIIPNIDGERTMPSVVYFENENPIVGIAAKNSSLVEPLNTVQYVKRQMGNPSYKFMTESGENYTAEEISAIILKRLIQDAEQYLNETINGCVITVPAYFNDAQRKSTMDAGKIAGLNVLRIINEPTAAALAYCYDKQIDSQTILVYDLGGGTFDVSILNVNIHDVQVIATGGDKNLGGFDWDNELMNYLNEEFKKKNNFDLLEIAESEQHLRSKAEEAKKILSTREKTNVILSISNKTTSIEISREKFEDLTSHLISKTLYIMEFVLEDANLSWRDVKKILLIGGSTRMKAVEFAVQKVSNIKPSREIHPDEAVALGAAIQASLIGKENNDLITSPFNLPLISVQDVNSHSLGTIAFDVNTNSDFNSIILKKDTPIPCQIGKIYYTLFDNQNELFVQITQGESEDVDDVFILGETILSIPPYPKNSPVEISFSYDLDGIIHVNVFDLTASNSLGEIYIKRNSNLNEDSILIMKRKITRLTIN